MFLVIFFGFRDLKCWLYNFYKILDRPDDFDVLALAECKHLNALHGIGKKLELDR
jgi:hypothetical protein